MNRFLLSALTITLVLSFGSLAGCRRAAPPPQVQAPSVPMVVSMAMAGAHNPGSLVDVPMLIEMMNRGDAVLVDVSPNPNNVIPGAIWIDRTSLYRNVDGNPSSAETAEVHARVLGANGISNNTTVILYDDANGMHAAKMFWQFRGMGHNDVRLLDGGLTAWTESGQPLQATASAPRPAATFTAVDNMHLRRVDLDEVLYTKGNPNWSIIDIRSPGEWSGGRIPGAIQMTFPRDFLNDNFTFRTVRDIEAAFGNIPRNTNIIVYCGSGLRASLAHFALVELLGWPMPVYNYEGSWSNWTWAGAPIEN